MPKEEPHHHRQADCCNPNRNCPCGRASTSSCYPSDVIPVATAAIAPQLKSCADVAKLRRPVSENHTICKNVAPSKQQLDKGGFTLCPTSKPVEFTLALFRVGSIGQFIKCLLKSCFVPNWAFLVVAFSVTSVVMILFYGPPAEPLVAAMMHIGFSCLPFYNIVRVRTW